MYYVLATLALAADIVSAYPFVTEMPGVNQDLLTSSRRFHRKRDAQPGSEAACPFNPDHVPAVGISSKFPYSNASNGLPGTGIGGYMVPAIGDTDHEFRAPGPNDIRGPCPGLNAAANHGFLARDGITTLNELLDAQQNMYNVGWDLAVLLALFGLEINDGDIATQRLSIGCDATNRTSVNPSVTGLEPGLDSHNKFESDSSLTRDDYFLGDGDNFTWNATLFGMMVDSTGGTFDRDGLSKYRHERYTQSRAENPNFYFGPLTILLYGAASFIYETMPSGPDYIPDIDTISSFFGASPNGYGGWKWSGGERIPPNWTNRLTPYTTANVTLEASYMFLANPVEFGGNTGDSTFDTIDFGSFIQNGELNTAEPENIACLLYQILTQTVSTGLDAVTVPTTAALNLVVGKLNPSFENFGCPLLITT